mmetsp:Transcript_67129/g.119468  ORF Transcript_67129/g.119468 Transcript_67129/m.119468 type:complete len:179 (+) Transcript_67129:107-643(+)
MYEDLELIRDDTLRLLNNTQDVAERQTMQEFEKLRRGTRNELSLREREECWHADAKVSAQFAYMRRLVRTEGFVSHVMGDFTELDLNKSGRLDIKELEDYLRNREMAGKGSKILFSNAKVPPQSAKSFLSDLDIDGDGQVSRPEWLMYVAYLHWQRYVTEYETIERTRPEKPGPCHCQ